MSNQLAPEEAAATAIDNILDNPDDWAGRFLTAYLQELGNLTRACKTAGIGRKVHYGRLERDPAYAALYQQTVEEFNDYLEHVAWDRAINGTDRPIYQGGRQVGLVNEVDNKHLQWMLERRNPERFHLPMIVQFATPTDSDFTFEMGEPRPSVELPAADYSDTDDTPAD